MEPFDIEKRGNFEQAFSLAFDGAEIAPDPHVWDKVDASLAKDQNSSFRKRLFILQLVAAASLIFAATVTLFQVFKGDTPTPISGEMLSEESPNIQELNTPENMERIQPLSESGDVDEEKFADDDPFLTQDSRKKALPTIADIRINKNSPLPGDEETRKENLIADKQSLAFTQVYQLGVEPRDYNIQTGLTRYEPLFVPVWTKKIDEDDLNMWASAGFAAGSYNPSSGGFGLGFTTAADEAAVPNGQFGADNVFSDEQAGRSIGGGIGFGGKIGRKWILESGINYLHSEIDGTTNSYVESNGRSFPVYYDTKFTGALNNVSSFGITNSLDFITVPMKAGYIIVDRKIGWVATGGIGSNILLGNTLTSDLGQLESISYSVSDSPYRRMSLSGIIGTEVYFNITKNYQLMVVPQYNFGITEITKQESSFSIVPNSFNLGLKFRYLLK